MNRPYPRRCAECGNKAVEPTKIKHTANILHNGTLRTVFVEELPVHQCNSCGCVTVGEDADALIRAKVREQYPE